MATKADFTEEEWKTLEKGVTGAGMLVSVSDADFTDAFGEASALGKALAARRDDASELVRELATTRGTGFGFTASAQEVETKTLAALRAGTGTLTAKAPDEVESYRRFVLDVAEAVAAAKGGGVSSDEATALDKVRQALGSA